MRIQIFLVTIFLSAFPLKAEDALLKSGDMVAIVGNTFVERARLYGELEFALQMAAGPEVNELRFRNLGWSGDSVYGDSRAYFGKPNEGRERLGRITKEIQPNVIILCYGTGEAMSVDSGWTDESTAAAGSAGGLEKSLETFLAGYRDLLKNVKTSAGGALREIVLVSPPPLENLAQPLPDQSQNNKNIAIFRDAIRDLAESEGIRFADLFAAMGGDDFSGKVTETPLTTNGIHFSEEGYRVAARELVKTLGYENASVITGTGEAASTLRNQIVEKNRLFFHRWRPANETYLFLFRKHEQGENAKEIPMFDPLIAAEEKKINKSRLAAIKGAGKE